MSEYKILSINPGSTSTKIGLFEGKNEVFKKTIQHAKEELAQFSKVADQKQYRQDMIEQALLDNGITLDDISAFAARGGGFAAIEGGVYSVNDIMADDALSMRRGEHPANLACTIAKDLAAKSKGQPCYIVNGPTADEYQDLSRLTGLKGIYRKMRGHALNQKEIGHRYAESQGKKYEDMNLIIAHIGGGISVVAHNKGKMIDASDASHGEGPMAPTRTGTVAVVDAINLIKDGMDMNELKLKSNLTGGWVDHLGEDNGMEVAKMIEGGNIYAKLVYDTTVYQIAKWIGMMAVPLKGKVDAVVLTGGLSNDKKMTAGITEYVSYIAPVEIMAGEYELEGLAAGVLRVLNGEETPKEYTGIDVFADFESRYNIK